MSEDVKSVNPEELRVVVTQPYLARYRVPLWEEVADRLVSRGATLRLLVSPVSGSQGRRSDSATLSIVEIVARREVATPLGTFYWRSRVWGSYDILVTELDPGNLNAWLSVLLSRATGRGRVLLWGHGKNYVGKRSALTERLRAWLARGAHHCLVYSPGGAEALRRNGVSSSKLTVIGNSTDTRRLQEEYRGLTCADRLDFNRKYGLAGRRLFHFVGGVDASKRIDFLIEVAKAAHQLDASFVLFVGGSGDAVSSLPRDASYIRHESYVDERMHALIGSLSEGCVMPGRVGLVAVDAQALGLKLFTTRHEYHAPELEFLVEGRDFDYLPDDPARFAAALILQRPRRQAASPPAELPTPVATIQTVAENFVGACLELLAEREL